MCNIILQKLYQGKFINREQSKIIFEKIIQNNLSPVQIAAMLMCMKIRGESLEEIIGAINALLKHAKPFPSPNYLFADITGTGGDNSNNINISTISAIVAASCGIRIAKHGNHSISSETGSADLIKKFKIPLNTSPEISRKTLDELGICFLYAPYYYTGFQNAMFVRKQLKTSTLFNIIGPLINPAKPPLTLIGVYKPELMLLMAKILKTLGYQRAAIVHCGGMDEIMLHAPIQIIELNDGKIEKYILTAEDFGLRSYPIINTVINASKKEKYNFTKKLLQGKGDPVYENIISANVAMLFKLFGKENLHNNTNLVLDNIRNGMPYKHLMLLVKKGIKNYEK
ncbi:anthranilate phosphoribosyltransferase [Blochmannia endosymbiont of Camponotus (Colobopsis) obliquus]|uniref:anthranilate phosphoribosyltransferase n=1 Tax=Blochmannia endosymbiont of Camponotus (Colobopsis) obliquus TaxID=1505597 RepID=UPI00061A6BFC|nr:anthranilate phosphoribosyltransferase [Blochmannia endosymbiont of Camponotus (Colobopsis) obliquus]AKC60581.1 anthranilate phosphoribosyltransferase [Blochmannia endosymbiont of Camponotus (Colobopsis) obliquus]